MCRGALAALVVALANVQIVFVTTSVDIAPGLRPLSLPSVVLSSVLGVAGATAVYWLLLRRTSNPGRTFFRVVSVFLLLSFVPYIGLFSADPAATLTGVLVLMGMHVVATAVSVAVLAGRAPRVTASTSSRPATVLGTIGRVSPQFPDQRVRRHDDHLESRSGQEREPGRSRGRVIPLALPPHRYLVLPDVPADPGRARISNSEE